MYGVCLYDISDHAGKNIERTGIVCDTDDRKLSDEYRYFSGDDFNLFEPNADRCADRLCWTYFYVFDHAVLLGGIFS